jgi:uncharacterized protein YciI
MRLLASLCTTLLIGVAAVHPAQAAERSIVGTGYDAALAERLGADERGMRKYVLVVLKTGPNRIPDGEERTTMFAGHFANMKRLSDEGKLALAGPFDGVDGWRGLFVLAVSDIDEAKAITATDPVIVKGEMVAEFHGWYGSAGVMMIPEIHQRLSQSPL